MAERRRMGRLATAEPKSTVAGRCGGAPASTVVDIDFPQFFYFPSDSATSRKKNPG